MSITDLMIQGRLKVFVNLCVGDNHVPLFGTSTYRELCRQLKHCRAFNRNLRLHNCSFDIISYNPLRVIEISADYIDELGK